MRKVIIGFSMFALSTGALADKGFYGEAMLGALQNEVSTSISGTIDGEPFSSSTSSSFDNSVALGIRGGYQFSPYVAVEASYLDFGEAKDEFIDDFGDNIKDSFETTAVNVAVKGIYPLTNSFSFNGKIGLANWDIDTSTTDSSLPGEVDTSSESGTDFFWSIGGEYKINQKLSLGLEYSKWVMNVDYEESGSILGIDFDFTGEVEVDVSGLFLTGRYML